MTRVISDMDEDMTDIAQKVKELCRNEPLTENEIIFVMPHWLTSNSRFDLPDIYYQY